jgi:hypothetical protein
MNQGNFEGSRGETEAHCIAEIAGAVVVEQHIQRIFEVLLLVQLRSFLPKRFVSSSA